jgi:hypothetical protein
LDKTINLEVANEMPIRAYTVRQAAQRFADSFAEHLRVNSAASFLDPTKCAACMDAHSDLVFALAWQGSPCQASDKIINLPEAQ